MSIADVIGWKFNHQPGMRCREDENGVIQIIEFPGGIPSQADQDAWTQEYINYINSDQHDSDTVTKDFNADRLKLIIAKALHNHENRIRALEGKPSVTLQQVIDALRKL
jgi:hypothetical protein